MVWQPIRMSGQAPGRKLFFKTGNAVLLNSSHRVLQPHDKYLSFRKHFRHVLFKDVFTINLCRPAGIGGLSDTRWVPILEISINALPKTLILNETNEKEFRRYGFKMDISIIKVRWGQKYGHLNLNMNFLMKNYALSQ